MVGHTGGGGRRLVVSSERPLLLKYVTVSRSQTFRSRQCCERVDYRIVDNLRGSFRRHLFSVDCAKGSNACSIFWWGQRQEGGGWMLVLR